MDDGRNIRSVADYLSEVTDETKTVFPSVLSDTKEVNSVLRKVVNSTDETLNRTGDPRVSFEVENLKQTIRESLKFSDNISQAARSVATYASNDGVLKYVKEELSKGHASQQRLKSYLDVVNKRVINCRERLGEIKTNYSSLSKVVLKRRERILESRNLLGRFFFLVTPATVGSSLVTVIGFMVVRFLMSRFSYHFYDVPLVENGDFINSSRQNMTIPVPRAVIPWLPLLVGVAMGIGFFYLAKKSGFHYQLLQTPPGVAILQSMVDSIATFHLKLQRNIGRLRRIERCLCDAMNIVSDERDTEEIETKLDEFKEEMKELLSSMDCN